MVFYGLLLLALVVPADGQIRGKDSEPKSEEITKLQYGNLTMEARSVQFNTNGTSRICSLTHDACVRFREVTVCADNILLECTSDDDFRLVCKGQCVWTHGNWNVGMKTFLGEHLIFCDGRIRVFGQAALRYGTGERLTHLACESITASNDGCYEFSGKVHLRHCDVSPCSPTKENASNEL